jgi:hypothetical protein
MSLQDVRLVRGKRGKTLTLGNGPMRSEVGSMGQLEPFFE